MDKPIYFMPGYVLQEELGAYAVEIFDGVGSYDSIAHVDMRNGGASPGVYQW